MFWCLWSFLAVTSFPSLCIPAGKSEKQSKMGFILAAARSLIECGKCLACGLYHESQIQVSDRADYVYVLCHHLGLLRLPALTFQEGNTSWWKLLLGAQEFRLPTQSGMHRKPRANKTTADILTSPPGDRTRLQHHCTTTPLPSVTLLFRCNHFSVSLLTLNRKKKMLFEVKIQRNCEQ